MKNECMVPFFMTPHGSTTLKSLTKISITESFFIFILDPNRNDNYLYYIAYV